MVTVICWLPAAFIQTAMGSPATPPLMFIINQLFVVPLSASEIMVSLAFTVAVLNQHAIETGVPVAGTVATSR